jgi:N-acylneuraminate cytidylyltransferase/CMP-N,N'-diacetyllegionaminic acid synthase
MKILCSICARGGSKGVPNKNIRLLLGKPLIAWTIEQARACGRFDVIAVSSDSQAILDAAKTAGADFPVKRPNELASDEAGKIPAIRHCVSVAETAHGQAFDVIVDLDCTSPLRTPADITAAIDLLLARKAPNLITAAPARRSPYFNLVEVDTEGRVQLAKPLTTPVLRRQDAPQCFDMNASIYVWQRAALFEDPPLFKPATALYVMPEDRSIDIDSELDFKMVETIMMARRQ